MQPCDRRQSSRFALIVLAAASMSWGLSGWAQAPCSAQHGAADAAAPNMAMKTFYLKNVSQQNDANEIMVALRNMVDPRSKIYLVNSRNAVVMEASPEQLELAEKLIGELDRPKKTYRLTFTIAEFDGNKRLAARHVTLLAVAGQRMVLKQGSKIPVSTAVYDSAGASPERTQVTYLDVGLNLDATVMELANGVSLKSKVEQSSLAEDKAPTGTLDPVVRQAVLEGTYDLVTGKQQTLGSLEIPDSARHLDIDVVAEPGS